MRAAAEWRDVDADTFRRDIRPLGKPAILRGLVANWPAVQEGLRSPSALCDYVASLQGDHTVETLIGDPSIKGHYFYRPDMSGLNFERISEPLRASLARMLEHVEDSSPPALSVQSTPLVAGFAAANPQPLLDNVVAPRIWIGNRVTVQTHYDLSYNIACVVAGRRRFTLFPPEQIANLYVGPFEFTPAGTPVSMASVEAPDFERYPRFAHALAAAETAELEPGDGLFIPFFWWHNVQSTEPFNTLVNYWWNEQPPRGAGYLCLLHSAMTLRDLPEEQRAAWRCLFDHLVFQTDGEPMAHLAHEHRGMLGPMTPERVRHIRSLVARSLSHDLR